VLARGADDQEFTWTLPILYDAAIRINQEPEAMFSSVVETGPAGQRVMQIFRWGQDSRRLKHDRGVVGADGFRYEAILEQNSAG